MANDQRTVFQNCNYKTKMRAYTVGNKESVARLHGLSSDSLKKYFLPRVHNSFLDLCLGPALLFEDCQWVNRQRRTLRVFIFRERMREPPQTSRPKMRVL